MKQGAVLIGACQPFGEDHIIASAVLGLMLSLRPTSQPPAQEPPFGRFQIAGSPGHAFVLDTATGQVWENFEPEAMGSGDAGFLLPKPKNK